MGLDMYLERERYVGAQHDFNKVEGVVAIKRCGKPVEIDLKKIKYVVEDAGYWRKANQIHKWFVDNVQDGEDDCKRYHVSNEELAELRELCKKVIETKDASLLPPQSGFFFGTTAVDELYYKDLKQTIEIIDGLDLEDGEYYYRSSW